MIGLPAASDEQADSSILASVSEESPARRGAADGRKKRTHQGSFEAVFATAFVSTRRCTTATSSLPRLSFSASSRLQWNTYGTTGLPLTQKARQRR